MVAIKGFKAYRPTKEYAEKVASKPYDVLNSQEAKELTKNNPYSFLHVVKPEIDLPDNVDIHGQEVYCKGAENLDNLIKDGILVQDEKEYLYLYSQKMGDHYQTGIVALSSCEDYVTGKIKKHEHTKPAKVKDRSEHILKAKAQCGPVFLTYKAIADLSNAIKAYTDSTEAEYDFTAPDGIQHTLWVIKDENLEKRIISEFESMPATYIADGHHRSESAGSYVYKNFPGPGRDFFLTVIFPDVEMLIMDYNRVVKDLNGHDKDSYLNEVKKIFQINEIDNGKPENKHDFGMYLDKKWYRLTIKSELIGNDPADSLDAALLQSNFLEPVLGIDKPRSSDRIDYIGGIRGLVELEKLVDSGSFKVAFALFPTLITDLMKVADAGKVMPCKSTWFEPKLRSGLIVNKFE